MAISRHSYIFCFASIASQHASSQRYGVRDHDLKLTFFTVEQIFMMLLHVTFSVLCILRYVKVIRHNR
jgi:hypothetical protein